MKKFILLSIAAFIISSCSIGASPEAGGAIVVLSQDSVNNTLDLNAKALKSGEACSMNILSLVTTGNQSIEEAKFNGGITHVVSVERDIKGWSLYLIFAKSCTIVKGY